MPQRRSTARDLAQIAVFAALIAAMGLPGQFYLTGSAVPITLQTLGVMLAGALLGPRKGLLAVATFDVLVACGLPLLAGGRGGLVSFTTAPSAGFLWGWLLGVAVIGALTRRILPRYRIWQGVIVTAVGGMGAVYLIGVPWLAVVGGLDLGKALAVTGGFVPGDALKVVVASLVAKQVHRAYPGLIDTTPTGANAAAQERRGGRLPTQASDDRRIRN